jgi:hypothetical protein
MAPRIHSSSTVHSFPGRKRETQQWLGTPLQEKASLGRCLQLIAGSRKPVPPSNCTPALTGCGARVPVLRGLRPHQDRPAEIRPLSAAMGCGPLRASRSIRQKRAPRPPPRSLALDRSLHRGTGCGIPVPCLRTPDGSARGIDPVHKAFGRHTGHEAANHEGTTRLPPAIIGLRSINRALRPGAGGARGTRWPWR